MGRGKPGKAGASNGTSKHVITYFEGFRRTLARAPAGLIRTGAPARAEDLAALAATGVSVPAVYRAFLREWDGADLFHESLFLRGCGHTAPARLAPPETAGAPTIFAEAANGDVFVFADEDAGPGGPAVWRVRAGSEDRWLAGSGFERWLDALIAHESVLYDSEGEFVLEAFESDGESLVPVFALRQAERAVRKDPSSAEYEHERALALQSLGRPEAAAEAFARAAELDPTNPWAAFDAGRAALTLGRAADAAALFAAAAEAGAAGEAAARLWAWCVHAWTQAGDRAPAEQARERARAADPGIAEALTRAAALLATEDPDGAAEAAALSLSFAGETPPTIPARLRLQVVREAPPAPAVPSRDEGRKPRRRRR